MPPAKGQLLVVPSIRIDVLSQADAPHRTISPRGVLHDQDICITRTNVGFLPSTERTQGPLVGELLQPL